MKKMLLCALMGLSLNVLANDDLTLPGAKWVAKSTGYVCEAYGAAVVGPVSHVDLDVKFENIVTDSTLDNGLVKATFTQDGSICRYSAILLADNALSTIKFVDSKAYAVSGNSDCLAGKQTLDENFAFNNYLYWGHPHHLTILVPATSAEAVCGAGATHVGIDFVVSGRLQN